MTRFGLVALLWCAACDDVGIRPADGAAAPWAGTWALVEEGGAAPASYEVDLTLRADRFESAYRDDLGQDCTWSGTIVRADDVEQDWTIDEASGAPCDMAVGETRTAGWTLADGDATLTLDWSGESFGTVQVYERR